MVGDTNLAVGLFGGKETVKDALYDRLFYNSKTRVEWSNLVGADLEISQGALTARGVYMQTDVRSTNPLEGLNDKAKLRAYGLATNLDLDAWFVLTEVTQLTSELNRIAGTNYKHVDAFDRAKARRIARIYLNHYASPKRLGRTASLQDYARTWNGGPSGHKKAATLGYWAKVQRELGR
jgi:hypothetical protein